ncbi:tetratricopeptide repeat protein [Hyalangium rubrum]|uniref:Tetratricopeptide repeat protein n=1 Tax=Hyalangium rubrum TaxID=3103134 RepID=A0ABU5H802_9BACT|nr:tetratricopeptide repeat protein [Hyalangium sp. s54d21]MDY7229598.1 tetratricopeptide repeat protein [Hyalangium sp. s54d21]
MTLHPATLLLLGLLLVPGLAWAQMTGIQLYENGEYEAAIRLLEQELAEASRSPGDPALSRVYLAASLHALGQVEEARKQLEVLARTHPEQQVDPVRFPPELVALAEVIRQQVEAERTFAEREAALQRAREEALQRIPPPAHLYLRPEALGLFEAVGRVWTVGAGASVRRESLEGSVRVLIGNPPTFHLQGGVLPGRGDWRPFLGLRAVMVPGLDSYGVGPVAGGRVALPAGLTAVLDLGADYFFTHRADRHRFAVTVQAGLGFDLRLK